MLRKDYKEIDLSCDMYIHSYNFILIITQIRQTTISTLINKAIEILTRLKRKGTWN